MKNAPQGTIGAPLLSHLCDCKLVCYCVLSKLVDLCLEINPVTYKTSLSFKKCFGLTTSMTSRMLFILSFEVLENWFVTSAAS